MRLPKTPLEVGIAGVAVVVASLALAAPAVAGPAPPDHSYADTSKVPIDPRTGEALAAPVRTPPSTPPDADVDDCTRQLPPQNVGSGHVRSRFLWCTRDGFFIVKNDGSGQARMHYTAVGYGRDDGVRDVTIFFRVDRVEALGSRPPHPSTQVTVDLECDDIYEEDLCHVSGGPHSGSLIQWDRDRNWYTLRVRSDDPGPLFGGVLNHRWRFVARYSGPDGSGQTHDLPWHNIRCDSADYFRQGGVRPKACIFDDVTPHLIYSMSDARVTEIARHIRDAQNDPGNTWPRFPSKAIPGKYFGGGRGLHRLQSGTPEYDDNRREVDDACHRRGRYVENGLPQPPGEGQHCDEYPFASTYEGAADDFVNFSVRAVPGGQNCSAGSLLGWYFTTDRILFGWNDEFWVDIRDSGAGAEPAPDVPPGGGEEDACSPIPPQTSPPRLPVGQLRISDVALTEGDSGSQEAAVTVSMSRPTGEPLSVSFATADGTATAPDDYQARSGRLTFGPDERSKRIVVPVNGDPVPEPDEDFFIRLSGVSGGSIVDGEARVIIRTDPEPALSIDDVRIEEEDADVTFTASLTEPNNTTASADFATADGTASARADYVAASGRIEIPAGATSARIPVRVKEDFDDEIDEETFKVALSNVANVFVTDGEGVAVIRDDDRNGLFTCRATAARLGSAEHRVANPPEHPCRDDSQASGLLEIGVGGIGVSLRTAAATDQTPDDLKGTKPAVGDKAVAHAEATDIAIRAGLNLVRIKAFTSDASAECASPPDAPRLASGSRITNLTVAGVQVPVGSGPLQVPLVLATLKLNDTVRAPNGVTQRALVLDQLLGPDLVLGEARAGWRGTAVHPDGHPCVV